MKTWVRHSIAFLDNEKSGGIILVVCTLTSLLLANSSIAGYYLDFWHLPLLSKPIEFWINDGLMTIFFLHVGLEIEREVYVGELNDLKKSMLPVLAALGGMLVPAAIHFSLNKGTATQSGFGVPMATDIAFSLGILSLLGNRVPLSLKLFLTALAIIDDLGAILVIAIFYASNISFFYLALAIGVFGLLFILNRMNVLSLWIYLLLGCVAWFLMHRSGIHATITGVVLAFTIPFRGGGERSPSTVLQRHLHRPVAFLVLPLFALVNTAIVIPSSVLSELVNANCVGIIAGLLMGKPIGIFLFSWIGLTIGWCMLPHGVKLKHIFSVGMVAGIGFTMSMFIALLAFDDKHTIDASKLAILTGSALSGILGLLSLTLLTSKK